MLFQGLVACFSPLVSENAKIEFVRRGGEIGTKFIATSYYFCSDTKDPCLEEWTVAQNLIVRHVQWIFDSIREDFLLPLAQYTMDSRFDATIIGRRFQAQPQRKNTLKRKLGRCSWDDGSSTALPGAKRQRVTMEVPGTGHDVPKVDVHIPDFDGCRAESTRTQLKTQRRVRFEACSTELDSKSLEVSESQVRKTFGPNDEKELVLPCSRREQRNSWSAYDPLALQMTSEGEDSCKIRVKHITRGHTTTATEGIRGREVSWAGSNSSARAPMPTLDNSNHGSGSDLNSGLSAFSGSEEEGSEGGEGLLSEEEVELELEPGSVTGSEPDEHVNMDWSLASGCTSRVGRLDSVTGFEDGRTRITGTVKQSFKGERHSACGGEREFEESIRAILARSTDRDTLRVPIEALLEAGSGRTQGLLLNPGVTCGGKRFHFSKLV